MDIGDTVVILSESWGWVGISPGDIGQVSGKIYPNTLLISIPTFNSYPHTWACLPGDVEKIVLE